MHRRLAAVSLCCAVASPLVVFAQQITEPQVLERVTVSARCADSSQLSA